MHILSTTDIVQNFYTHSSEALSPFYKCFVIPLWWRRDTFTENYSFRDINHHLRNEPAICLEGFLEPTKAKFKNKNPMGVIWREKTSPEGWRQCMHELFHTLGISSLCDGIRHTICPLWERKVMPLEAESGLKGHLLKTENSALRYDFDMDLLWTSYIPDSNLSLNHGKITVEPTSREVLDISYKQNRHKLDAHGAHIHADETAKLIENRRELSYGLIST